MSRKSELFILDFVIGVIIFLSIFLVNQFAWQQQEEYTLNAYLKLRTFTNLVEISQALTKSPGAPRNWDYLTVRNETTVNGLGLCDIPNFINNHKLSAFNQTSYNDTANILLQSGDYYLEIINNTQTIFTYGMTPSPNGTIIKITRMVRINNNIYQLNLYGWYVI